MEGNFQNMNPTTTGNQNNAEEIVPNDALLIPQDAKQVQIEIMKMKEARQKSLDNTVHLQRKLDEEQKTFQEKQIARTNLEKNIVQLQCKLNDEKYQNATMKTEVMKIHEMSKEIGKFCLRNERILQQCSQDKTSTLERHEKLRTKICDNLTKLEEVCNKKPCEVALLKETVLSQQEVHQECLEKREVECLERKEKLEVSNAELESSEKQYNELSANNNCLNNSDAKDNNMQLEEIWHCRQKHSGDLLEQMQEQLREFEQRKEEISNSLDEARYTLQRKETEIEGVQRGIKNQTKYNKNFREKLATKIKEIADLRLQNDQLEAAHKERQIRLVSNEQSLTALLNSKLEEEENAKALLSEERKILNKTEEQINDAKQMNEDLVRHIETQENVVADLKNKQNNQLEAITAFEQELLSLQFKLNNLKKELSEWQMKFVKYESSMLQLIANKTSTTKTVAVETEEIKIKEEETKTAVFQEMSSIKSNFDIETPQETGDFEEKQKQLQQQIQNIEKELSYTRNLQVQLDEELEQLNKDCENISKKIKDQEDLNHTLSIISEVEFEAPALPLPPSKVGQGSRTGSASTVSRAVRTGTASAVSDTSITGSTSTVDCVSSPSTSTLILPPTGPVKPRAFDELSGSSGEGNVATYHQILELKREKQRRRQLREQQRLRSKNKSASQSKAPGK